MRLRYWVTDAKSGAVVSEVRAVGAVSLSSRLGGGTMSASIAVDALTRDGSAPDWAEVSRVGGLLVGGRRCLAVTAGTALLGEWLIMRRTLDTGSALVGVQGMSWEGYPALRSLNANYIYTNTSQATIAKALLDAAFTSFNTGMTITVPATSSAVTRTIDRRSHSAYYSDVLAEIGDPDDGFEWCVDTTPSWDGDRLTSVGRAVGWGFPVLARSSSARIVMGDPGTRHGNAVSIRGGDDFSRYAQSVYGIGEGSGDKQLWVGLSDPTLTNAGYLNSTKNVSFPGVSDVGALTALTRGALVDAQNLLDPYEAEVRVDDMLLLPRVGRVVQLVAPQTWAYPAGLDVSVRVGDVTYSAQGAECEIATVTAA